MHNIRSLRQLTDEQLERIGLKYGEIGELKSELDVTIHGRYSRIILLRSGTPIRSLSWSKMC